jgi:hypothetical protein
MSLALASTGTLSVRAPTFLCGAKNALGTGVGTRARWGGGRNVPRALPGWWCALAAGDPASDNTLDHVDHPRAINTQAHTYTLSHGREGKREAASISCMCFCVVNAARQMMSSESTCGRRSRRRFVAPRLPMPLADAQKTMQTTLTHSKHRRWLMPSSFTN